MLEDRHQYLSTVQSGRKTTLRALTLVSVCVLWQCKPTDPNKSPPPQLTGGSSNSEGGTTNGGTMQAGGSQNEKGGTSGDGGTAGGENGCPYGWNSCPPMDTLLEPLQKRDIGAGSLVVAHEAIWLQGQIGMDGTLYNGRLRVPLQPGGTPLVLEGDAHNGSILAHNGFIYFSDIGHGRTISVHQPNGDLLKSIDITQGDTSITYLGKMDIKDGLLAVSNPTCLSVFVVDLSDDSVKRLDTDAVYAGGSTSVVFADDHLCCIGNDFIYKIEPHTMDIVAEWENPETDLSYGWIYDTPQGLLTYTTLPVYRSYVYQLMDPLTLALSEYHASEEFMGARHYAPDENAI